MKIRTESKDIKSSELTRTGPSFNIAVKAEYISVTKGCRVSEIWRPST